MGTSCAPLVLRSNHSLLHGTTPVERVIEEAARRGYGAVALTDRHNLYGAIPFYKLAREAGLKPILGAEVRDGGRRAVLLAKSYAGYSNLCRILSRKHLEEDFSLAAAISSNSTNLENDEIRRGERRSPAVQTCGSDQGERRSPLQDGMPPGPPSHEGAYADLFFLTDSLSLAAELKSRVTPGNLFLLWALPERARRFDVFGEAKRLGLPVVATPDVSFLDPEEYEVHRLLKAIGGNTILSRLDASDLAPQTGFLPSAKTFQELAVTYPEALRNNARIVEECNLEIPMGKPIFPKFPLPDGGRAIKFLRKLCMEGMPRRYPGDAGQAPARLEHELRIIEKLGFTEYFIFVWDILGYAREKGIATIGRGSGASSIVSYLLGVTSVDPLAYNIPFERFLHLKRADCPDLDIDLCWIRRDEVIESIYRKYGASRVAMVSTHATFRLRGAVRETGKALGMSNDLVNRIGHRLPYDSDDPVADVLSRALPKNLAASIEPETWRELCSLAERIRGFPHNISVHCGGLVIADRPLDTYVPLERAAKGVVITQYEKDAVEEIGLVKMDFLGNHGLTIRDEAVRFVAERTGEIINVDSIPNRDPATTALLKNGRTLGCCQLESPAMRHLLQMFRAGSVRDVMQALALVRPGPASLSVKEKFVRRVRGLEPADLPHSSLAGALGDSYGIMLYEDDAMLVACALAGVTAEEGDLLRKAISKARTRDALRKASEEFIHKARANGVSLDVAKEMWVQMAKFNAYSFCKAHAASYAILAYQIAWLKARHPLEFMTAALNHQWGMYPKRVHLEEAKRLGLRILPPCVNRSERMFIVEDDAIRIGLEQVRGLTAATIEAILDERARRRFESVEDFMSRLRAGRQELRNLVLCGAFDFTGRVRPELIWAVERVGGRGAVGSDGGEMLFQRPAGPPTFALADYSEETKFRNEMEVLELAVSRHPLEFVRPYLRVNGIADSREVPRRLGKRIRLAGILAALRETPTSRGAMEFLTLEDEFGIFEVVLFPEIYRACRRAIEDAGPYLVEGTVEEQYDVLTINARSIGKLQTNGPAFSNRRTPSLKAC
jgi:DNA-directed DNA polymerase III PolC